MNRQFRAIVRRQLRSGTRNTPEVDKKVHREFVRWFSNRVSVCVYVFNVYILIGM